MADLAARPPARPAAPNAARRLAVPRVEPEALWRALWSPFWAWSDLPAPDLPAREPKPAGPLGPAGEALLAGLDTVRRRLWLRHGLLILVRAVWLGLAGACLWVLLGLPADGPALDLRVLGRVLLGLVLLGAAFAVSAKPGRARTARMLDRTFGLQERLSTAVEDLGQGVPGPGERAPVVYLQMADGANAMDELRRHPALGWKVPTREIVLAVFWGLTLAALAFLRGVGGGVPPLATAAAPPFTPAIERPEPPPAVAPAELTDGAVPSVQEVLERSNRSAEARQDLEALAAALSDHAVTSETSEAIREGNYERAADGLRELAPDAGELSEASRGELASDLEGAAGQMAPEGEGLQQASEQAAAGLRQGEQPATDGLRSLAEAVEQTGEQVAPQGELAEQMQQAQQAAAQGEPGQSEAGDPSQGQPGEGQPQGQPQAGDDPGAGADAQGQSGEANQAGDASQGDPGEPGQSEQGGAPGDAGQPGESGQSGAGEQPGDPSEAGTQGQGQGQAPGEGEPGIAAQGAGAGGEGQEQAGERDASAGAGEGQEAGAGEAAEERVAEGDGGRGEAGAPAEVTEAISLPPGEGNQGVQTSGDGGSSLLGSGAGVTAGSGDAVQGEVDEAGPDSNHVPPEHRGLVERYFGDPFAALDPEP